MNQEYIERLNELEERLELGDELDEDERAELRGLRSARRSERATAKLLQRFRKAKRVWRLRDIDNDEPTADGYLYALSYGDLRDLLRVEDGDPLLDAIEEVDRPERAETLAVSALAKVFWFWPNEVTQ